MLGAETNLGVSEAFGGVLEHQNLDTATDTILVKLARRKFRIRNTFFKDFDFFKEERFFKFNS